MECSELAPESAEFPEEIETFGQGESREVDLQKFGIAASVAGTVEHRVSVMKDFFGL